MLLQAKSLVDPFAYDAYIEQRKKEKLDEERANRITVIHFLSQNTVILYYLSFDQFVNILVCFFDANFILFFL